MDTSPRGFLPLTLLPKMDKNIIGIETSFDFNAPAKDEGDIAENFDYYAKAAYVTPGASEFVKEKLAENGTQERFASVFLATVFETLREKAFEERLDYLQKLTIAGEQFWVIDNGEYITLMLPSEY